MAMGLKFSWAGTEYAAETAAEIVRAMAQGSSAAAARPAEMRALVERALEGLVDHVHIRELDVGRHVSDEALAYNYLCLLDRYGIGRLHSCSRTPNETGNR
jgi:hypothetical protein